MSVADGQLIWARSTEISARALTVYRALGLSSARDINDVINLVANFCGKQIRIEAVGNKKWEKVTGLVFHHDKYIRILVRSSDTRIFRCHCVLHELSHVLLEHPDCQCLNKVGVEQRNGSPVGRARFTDRDMSPEDRILEGEAEALAGFIALDVLTPDFRSEEPFG
ncbi:hypothetical protein HQQ81_20965 [Microbacteriaceae bacterium VKM Ac-2854]|nr:hypothetical protein [Microbacteriaceae bacterium VKM Ac-2854]